jgi:hypothetical protein
MDQDLEKLQTYWEMMKVQVDFAIYLHKKGDCSQ